MTPSQRNSFIADYPKLFDSIVDRLLNSPNAEERKQVFLGFSRDGQHPIIVPRPTFFSHGHTLGDSGSGKSAKVVAPVAAQLIGATDCSVIFLDLKGDMALFHGAREEAERAGLPFKYFTNRIGWASYLWNPMTEPYFSNRLSPVQRAQHIITSLGLDHGEIYGGGYFTSCMRLVSAQILKKYPEASRSLVDFLRYCADPAAYKGLGPVKDWENSRHLIAVLYTLASVLVLNGTEQTVQEHPQALAERISVEEILKTPTVVYLFLQSPLDPALATNIARLFLYSLLAAAAIYQYDKTPTRDVFVFIDEAQQLATQGFPLILNQARSHRIGCILAHQSLDQLKINSDLDLTQIVLSSTAVKQIFRSSDRLSRKYITETGGEALFHNLSWKQPTPLKDGEPPEPALTPAAANVDPLSGSPILNAREEIRPRMEPNTIMEISADPSLSLIGITENNGAVKSDAAWTPVISGFHITRDEYERRRNLPWPSLNTSTVVVPLEWQPPGSPPAVSQSLADGEDELSRRIEEGIKKLKRGNRRG